MRSARQDGSRGVFQPSGLPVPEGLAPLLPLNEARVRTVVVPLGIQKTVPSPEAPPPDVVPYRFPRASSVTDASGCAPLSPLNDASRSRETIAAGIANPIPLGVYDGGRQIGFARIVTDRATFA